MSEQTPDPTPAHLSAARLAEIRRMFSDVAMAHDFRGPAAALLAHLDALAPRAPVDGEALCLRVFMEQQGFTPEEAAESWAALSPAGRAENVRIGTALHAIGYAAGRSEGEAERARLADALECMRVERDHFCAEKDRIYREEAQVNAEIASLTAERDAMAAELTTIRRLHDIATGNREAARAEACDVIDRLGAEVAKRDAEIARLTVERDAAEQLTAAAVETGAADRERALNAEAAIEAEAAVAAELRAMETEALASADRWKAASEQHERERDAMAAELAEVRDAVEHARMDVKMTSVLQEMAEYDASVARRDGAREEREATARWLREEGQDQTAMRYERAVRARGEGQGS